MRDRCGHHVQHLSSLTQGVTTHAHAASLELLKAVDMTVEALAALQSQGREALALARGCADAVKQCEPESVIDPEFVRCKEIETAEQALAVERETLRLKLAAARDDDRLRGDHEDSVVTEYEGAIEVCEALHDALVDLRWAVLEHDADLDAGREAPGDVLSIDDLIRELHV